MIQKPKGTKDLLPEESYKWQELEKNIKQCLNKNELLKDFEKDRLYEFLENINKYGISEAKEMYDSNTFREYSRKIRKMGINILCFSPVIGGKKITIKKMDNFTLLQNGIADDI